MFDRKSRSERHPPETRPPVMRFDTPAPSRFPARTRLLAVLVATGTLGGALLAAGIGSAPGATAAGAHADRETARGVVYADLNGNGVRDPGEPGIQGVLVSNQLDVVRTDAEGRFTLSVVAGQAIYVQKPADHDVPLLPGNLPHFSYVHEPGGSPGLRFGGIAPTGPLPELLEFALLPGERQANFTAAIFGDPQPRDDQQLDYIRDDALAELAQSGADFTLVLGDVAYDTLSVYHRYRELTGSLGMPVWHVVGNHDIDYDAGSNRHGRDTFRGVFGANRYSFEYGDVLFIVLDNIDYQGLNEERRPRYRGYLGDEQIRWVRNLLAETPKDRLVVLAMHIPLFAWGGETENVNTADRAQLLGLFEGRRAVAVTGHLHMVYHHFLGAEFGWPNAEPLHHLVTSTVSGTWWGGPKDERGIPSAMQRDGVPNGYHLFTFNGAHYRETIRGFGADRETQIRVEAPVGAVRAGELDGTSLIVNVFSGNERNRVEARVNGGPWFPMENVTGPSPAFESLLTRNPETFGATVRAIPTNHLWSAPIPPALRWPGVHRIEVRTVDAFGQLHTGAGVVEVAR
jgi:hypothetical protein